MDKYSKIFGVCQGECEKIKKIPLTILQKKSKFCTKIRLVFYEKH